MPSPTLSSLPPSSLHQLAALLQTRPHEHGLSHSERVSATIPKLPSCLKKQRSLLSNLFSTHTPHPLIQSRLCLLHKPLSSTLIHEIFTLISLEVGHHCNSLTQHNTWLSPKQHVDLQRLRELHSLWLPEQTYRQTFLTAPNPQWPHQESGCEGCILTRIGGDLQIVVGLRALLLSRRRTVKPRKGRPTLLGWVDAWVDGLLGDGENYREWMQGSEMEGEELKIVRKRIWRERREKKRVAKGKGREVEKEKEKEGKEQVDQEVYESDFEHEIIDHYAALRSTLHLPATQSSLMQTPSLTTGTSAECASSDIDISDSLNPSRSCYPQASSTYSLHPSHIPSTYVPPRRGKAWQAQGQASAENQACEYRNLLTPPPEQPLPRSQTIPKQEKKRETREHCALLTPPPPKEPLPRPRAVKEEKKRQTTWSQFCE